MSGDHRTMTPTGNPFIDLLRQDLRDHREDDIRAQDAIRAELGPLGVETQRQSLALARIETKLGSAAWIITTAIAAAGIVIGLLAAHAAHL